MAGIVYKNEGIVRKKVLVVTDNRDCVEAVLRVAADGIAASIESSSLVEKGLLLHIPYSATDGEVERVLSKIGEVVAGIDKSASIKAFNCPDPGKPP